MKNRKRENCTSGTVRDEGGNILIYSANDRGDRGNVGIIRSPIRASILPDHFRHPLLLEGGYNLVARIAKLGGRREIPTAAARVPTCVAVAPRKDEGP